MREKLSKSKVQAHFIAVTLLVPMVLDGKYSAHLSALVLSAPECTSSCPPPLIPCNPKGLMGAAIGWIYIWLSSLQ